MTPEQFCYWLQGMLESGKEKWLDTEQTQMVRDHLKTVFHKVTPNYDLYRQLTTPDPGNPGLWFDRIVC